MDLAYFTDLCLSVLLTSLNLKNKQTIQYVFAFVIFITDFFSTLFPELNFFSFLQGDNHPVRTAVFDIV